MIRKLEHPPIASPPGTVPDITPDYSRFNAYQSAAHTGYSQVSITNWYDDMGVPIVAAGSLIEAHGVFYSNDADVAAYVPDDLANGKTVLVFNADEERYELSDTEPEWSVARNAYYSNSHRCTGHIIFHRNGEFLCKYQIDQTQAGHMDGAHPVTLWACPITCKAWHHSGTANHLCPMDYGDRVTDGVVNYRSKTLTLSVTSPVAAVKTKDYLIVAETGTIYVYNGYGPTLNTSFSAPASGIEDIAWDGENLIIGTASTVYVMDGISSTVTRSFGIPLPTGSGQELRGVAHTGDHLVLLISYYGTLPPSNWGGWYYIYNADGTVLQDDYPNRLDVSATVVDARGIDWSGDNLILYYSSWYDNGITPGWTASVAFHPGIEKWWWSYYEAYQQAYRGSIAGIAPYDPVSGESYTEKPAFFYDGTSVYWYCSGLGVWQCLGMEP